MGSEPKDEKRNTAEFRQIDKGDELEIKSILLIDFLNREDIIRSWQGDD